MREKYGFLGKALRTAALYGMAIGMTLPAGAQDLRDVRIDPHPIRTQVGLVTRVLSTSAWIKMPRRVNVGMTVAFMPYSDGGDTLAVGQVNWVAPLPPYEAYVTGIKAVSTKHRANPYNTLGAFETVTNLKVESKPRQETDPHGVSLAIGFFARLPLLPEETNEEAVEPVRAHIAALRARKSQTATAIADAIERALKATPFLTTPGQPEEEAVNYPAIAENLRRFRRLIIPDPITERLFRRVLHLVEESGSLGEAVPIDFLRAPQELFTQTPGLRR